MAEGKIKREPQTHLVVPDTSALWEKDKALPVSPEFEAFWEEHNGLARLELVVPETVLGELAFQQTSSAWKSADKVSAELKTLSGVTGSVHTKRIDRSRVRSQVEGKIDRWLRSKGGSAESLPIGAIDWRSVCDGAVWRLPPFTNDPSRPELEKGFRDSLILETLVHIAEAEERDVTIAFLCTDRLLRETATSRLRHDPRVTCFESLGDFSSYLRLLRDDHDRKFIGAIVEKATRKFFSPGDHATLYLREGVMKRAKEIAQSELDDPSMSVDGPAETLLPLVESWRVLRRRWWLARAEFQEREGDKTYVWMSRLTYAAACTPITKFSEVPQDMAKFLHLVAFDVTWTADVSVDQRFRNVALRSIELSEKKCTLTSEEQQARYGVGEEGP